MFRNCLNLTKTKISKKHFFGKIRGLFKSKLDDKIEEEATDINEVSFKTFTDYLIERKEYKLRDYEDQIEVIFIKVERDFWEK